MALKKALTLDSNLKKAYNYLGNAKTDLGNFEEAIRDYNKAIVFDAEYTAAYFNRGIAKAKLNKHEEAIEDFTKAIDIDPQFAYAFNERGVAKFNLNRYEEAIEDYNKAIDIDPQFAYAFNNRGVAKFNLNRYEEAIEDYNKAIDIDPQVANAFNNCVVAKFNLNRYEEAIEDCNKAIDMDPSDALAYINRGNSKAKLGRNEEAILDYNKAIDIDPFDVEAHINRGSSKVELGKYNEAIEDLNKALQMNSSNALAFDLRGQARYLSGDIYEASFDFYRALSLNNFILPNLILLNYFHITYLAPFTLNKILLTNLHIRTSISFQSYVTENDKDCYNLLLWMAWLDISSFLIQKNEITVSKSQALNTQSKNSEWLRALIMFNAGNPISSFNIIEEIDYGDAKLKLIKQQYFYVLSADYILHDEREAIREYAKKAALELSMSQGGNESQNYWAGRLLLYCEEYDAAIKCFNNCQSLGVFHYLSICEAYRLKGLDDSEIAEKALQLAQLTNWSPSTILAKKQLLPLEDIGQYLEEIEDVLRYYDAEEIINWIFADGNIKPRFWEIWDADSLIEPLRNYRIAELEQKIRNEFEETLSTLIENKQPDSSIFKNPKEPHRWEAFKRLNHSDEVIFEISILIYNTVLPQKVIADLLEYFYLLKKISVDDAYYLYFYLSVCKKTTTPNQAMVDGSTESGKVIIENALSKLIEYGFVAGMTSLGFWIDPIVSGAGLTFAVLGKKFVLDNLSSTNKTFEEFKKDFQLFIFNEYELLGEEKFYEKYPLHGFDDFLKRK